jgi:hypothetical protein
MPIKPEHLTLHRYFLNASRNRSLFLQKLQAGELDHLHTTVHLDLWYGCLFVVVEGWHKEKINDHAVTALLRDVQNRKLLEDYRNAVFHYHPNYVDSRRDAVFRSAEFVEWVNALHDAISSYFLGTEPE